MCYGPGAIGSKANRRRKLARHDGRLQGLDLKIGVTQARLPEFAT